MGRSWNGGKLGDTLLICIGYVDFTAIITEFVQLQLDPILSYSEDATQDLIDSTPRKFPWANLGKVIYQVSVFVYVLSLHLH